MLKRTIIRNKSDKDLEIMLEPWLDRDTIPPQGSAVIEGEYSDEELVLDVFGEAFVSVWSPAHATIRVYSASDSPL